MACIQRNSEQTKNNFIFFGGIIPGGTNPRTENFMIPFQYLPFINNILTDETGALNGSLHFINETQINNISISIATNFPSPYNISVIVGIIIGTGDILKVSKQSPIYTTSLTLPEGQLYANQVFNNVNLVVPANSWMFVFNSLNEPQFSEIFLNVSFG
jgi:hypothetical protein